MAVAEKSRNVFCALTESCSAIASIRVSHPSHRSLLASRMFTRVRSSDFFEIDSVPKVVPKVHCTLAFTLKYFTLKYVL